MMHWAWRIAVEGCDPRLVPDIKGVGIQSWHGEKGDSREVAWQMVDEFGVRGHNEIVIMETPRGDTNPTLMYIAKKKGMIQILDVPDLDSIQWASKDVEDFGV